METVYINGIGILSRIAQSSEELAAFLENAGSTDTELPFNGTIEYTPVVPKAKLRRCSHYTKLAVETAFRAKEDAKCHGAVLDLSGETGEGVSPYRIGTVISSGYGAVEQSVRFTDTVVGGVPGECSPFVFSGTVPNSCVGQMCIVGGWKGPSTLLMGGDPIEYAAILLASQKADVILCGGVEEYFEELADSIGTVGLLGKERIAEGAAVLALERQKREDTYCGIHKCAGASLAQYPYLHKIADEEILSAMRQTLSDLNAGSVDAVFTADNGSWVDGLERQVLKEYFPDVKRLAPKAYFGETLGSGYLLSVALAAVCIREGKLPGAVGEKVPDLRSILVTGIDTAGNYLCTVLANG